MNIEKMTGWEILGADRIFVLYEERSAIYARRIL